MKVNLSALEIGNRIAELRKAKGLSQEEVSKELGVSRSSLTQIELGKRSLNVIEIQKLSSVLEFSVDEFLSPDFFLDQAKDKVIEDLMTEKEEIRISVPTLNVKKFINILLYILERCGGKPNVGETVLYKLLYFSDFNYYELYEEHLSGAQYRKLPYGPVPQKLDVIIQKMIEDKQLKRVKTTYFDKLQTRYIPLIKADLTMLLASEKEVIDRVIEQMSDWSAAMISHYSHEDKPWKATDMSDVIDYELAFYRKSPYTVRVYKEDEEDAF